MAMNASLEELEAMQNRLHETRDRWLERNLCRDCGDAYLAQVTEMRRAVAMLRQRFGHLEKVAETWP